MPTTAWERTMFTWDKKTAHKLSSPFTRSSGQNIWQKLKRRGQRFSSSSIPRRPRLLPSLDSRNALAQTEEPGRIRVDTRWKHVKISNTEIEWGHHHSVAHLRRRFQRWGHSVLGRLPDSSDTLGASSCAKRLE